MEDITGVVAVVADDITEVVVVMWRQLQRW
jgi:hypothetical protein